MVGQMWREARHGNVVVLSAAAPLTTNEQVEHALAELETRLAAEPGGRWTIDGSGIESVTSEAIAILIRIVRRVTMAGGRVALAQPRPFVRGVLQSMRIVKILPIHDSVDQAVEQLA